MATTADRHYQGDKAALIEELQNLGRFWDSAAQSQSVTAIESGKKEDLESARLCVARARACEEMAKKAIEAVHRFFREV